MSFFMDAIPDPLFRGVMAVFGLLIGSFLNVVIHRLPEKRSIVRPRSSCPVCGHSLSWYDNIPVFSYLFLRGKCRGCRIPISVRYPLVELMTALLFIAVLNRFGFSPLLIVRDLPFVSILIAVTFIDLQHRIIPDVLSLGGLGLGLLTAWWDPALGLGGALLGAALGFGIFYGAAWFYLWRTGRSGLGGGDIKLLAMLGAFVGAQGVVTTILISSVLGTVFGIVVYLAQKRTGSADGAPGEEGLMKFSIPYGPFLVLGALYAYLLSEVVWSPFMNRM